MSTAKDYQKTIELNKRPFEETFGKKWDEDLSAFLSYVNGIYLATLANSLNRELPPLIDKIDRTGHVVSKILHNLEDK